MLQFCSTVSFLLKNHANKSLVLSDFRFGPLELLPFLDDHQCCFFRIAAMAEIVRKRSVHIRDTRIAGLYDLEHTIGQGHFAVVKLARHVFTGERVGSSSFCCKKPTSSHLCI